MRAVVYKGPRTVAVEQVEDPRIESATDAIVRISSAGICGSDLHMYEGRTVAQAGITFGHENTGIVEEIGSAVQSIHLGDRVVMPFNIACGSCFNCIRGFTNACLTANPTGVSAGYGYAGMGPYGGGQAELCRVPFADFNCLKLPGTAGDEFEDDFVLLSDVFPTGYHATELAGVEPGSTVAVFGAGPIGLISAYCARLRGATEVYIVDAVPERLAKAQELGGQPVDFRLGDPVEQILALRATVRSRSAMRPGEEKMPGVMCGIDAVGYQAKDAHDPSYEQPNQVLNQLVRIVNSTGKIGVVGVYLPIDPGASDRNAKHGELDLSWGTVFEKGIQVGTGQTPVKRYNVRLRDLIMAGRARPSLIVSQHLPLEEAPRAYDRFDRRVEGFTKVILKPAA